MQFITKLYEIRVYNKKHSFKIKKIQKDLPNLNRISECLNLTTNLFCLQIPIIFHIESPKQPLQKS